MKILNLKQTRKKSSNIQQNQKTQINRKYQTIVLIWPSVKGYIYQKYVSMEYVSFQNGTQLPM